MRTRYKRMADYGISEQRAAQLRLMAKDEDYWDLLEQAALQSHEYLSSFIVQYLTSEERTGFRIIFRYAEFLPCSENDFYAYARKTLARFNELLEAESLIQPNENNNIVGLEEGVFLEKI